MIEIFMIIAFLFLVAVFFYKQALEQFDVLQIESTQLDQLPKLLAEKSFLVVRSLPTIQLWTSQTVKEIHRIHQAPYGKGKLLEIAEGKSAGLPSKYPGSSEKLAEQVGVQTWVDTTWLPKVTESSWFKWAFSSRTEVAVGAKGLRKSVAYATMILPTEGDLIVSVMPESSETYLPKQWQGKLFNQIKRAEAPLIGEVKYLDIKVRKGSALFIPPHWIVNIQEDTEKEKQTPWFIWAEFHHPMSKFAHLLNA
jgi:hypothetical protein